MLRSLLLVLFLISTVGYSMNAVTVNPKRSVWVQGVVNWSILKEADKLQELSQDSKEPVHIVITSPGGSVAAGTTFIDSMEAARSRGVELHCVVPTFAASMAFQFLLHCDKVYAHRYAKLLFHPVATYFDGRITPTVSRDLLAILERIEHKMVPEITEKLGRNDDAFRKHYEAETLWDAEDLLEFSKRNWLTLVDKIDGVPAVFSIIPGGSGNEGRIRACVMDTVTYIWKEMCR